ncbi:putative zinc finger protein family member [Leptomonas pyrrhocoris]|uniref:Putative zinc finger protein family member n=1 Tax=Leptomonas pyrrhocoris TaxID=157538 RepID=A0A0M9GA69_LEPPY|nr:putative zinc finger protein family member [Leptomonas pyrrhocoris]XP_015664426.1 putative zinc finger protein family member [Leptomonas pyrrhocoris]KPA85986.1 putative zinc finger protein family member [Leptomonas pyrrhocoris]KPA85987.1 putative zinc finger protein family member [Leptomonas pyrrhocoris]|eukprot:XP_015664425.1 putative zinc finger protein family member [Leptomonas pyrrhocoris]
MDASSNASAPPPPPHTAEFWINNLQLAPHPEGGYYREVVHSLHEVDNEVGARRLAYTSIYFLLTPESPSHLHRLCSDETWFHHVGDPLQVHVLLKDPQDEDRIAVPPRAPPKGSEVAAADARPYQAYRRVLMGPCVDRGEVLQYTVPGGAIFGTSVNAAGAMAQAGYSLVSCVVSPGFDYADFELLTQAQLMELCPQHEAVIRQMAYEAIPS